MGILIVILSYLIGCFSTGYYLVRLRLGEDIRELGTRSAGGRNVARFLGPGGFLITGAGDTIKATLATWLAMSFGENQWVMLGAIVAVVLGHIWPVQLGFKGGKGISAAFGSLLVFEYRFVLIWLVLAFVIWIVSRRVTLSGILAITLTPLVSLFLNFEVERLILIFVIVGLLLIAHRTNIAKILNKSGG